MYVCAILHACFFLWMDGNVIRCLTVADGIQRGVKTRMQFNVGISSTRLETVSFSKS